MSGGRQENPDTVVRMGAAGRRRLGTSSEFSATVDAHVPHSTHLSDAEAKRRDEFIEQVTDDGTHKGLIAITPHGGRIEPHTDKQAERVRHALAAKV